METPLNDAHFMRKALQEAMVAYEKDEVPVGAIVVMENKIIGRGHNLTETLRDPTAHAEMIALTAAFSYLGAKYLPDATLYVTLEPCLMCAGALYWSKIGRIVYGASDFKHGYRKAFQASEAGSAQANAVFHPKTHLVGGIHEAECAKIMTQFFQARR